MFLIQLVGEMLVLMSRTLHLHHLLKQGWRLWWRLESSVWLCDTEIYSTGFQGGMDSFHLCHSIPPGLSHLFLWHSLKAWPQKRTLWTMGLFPYSAFSDLLNSCSSIVQLVHSPPSQAPRSQASWEFTLNICLTAQEPHIPVLHSTTSESDPGSFSGTLTCTCCGSPSHLRARGTFIDIHSKTSLACSERGGFKRKYFSLSPRFISELKRKSWIARSSFSKHLLLDVK